MVVSSPVFERWTGMSTAGPRPLSLCARVYMPRLLLGLATAAVVSHAAAVLPVAEGEPLPLLLYGTILAFSVVGSVFATVMFVAQMAFFARVADPAIGGTYMTRAPQIFSSGALTASCLTFPSAKTGLALSPCGCCACQPC